MLFPTQHIEMLDNGIYEYSPEKTEQKEGTCMFLGSHLSQLL